MIRFASKDIAHRALRTAWLLRVRPLVLLAMVVFCGTSLSDATARELRSPRTVVVGDVHALEAALVQANAGRRIVVRAGLYEIDAPLSVPDGATLEGEGTATRIKALPSLSGDMLTLGDDVTLRGLAVEDAVGRVGNVVMVGSRSPGDSLSVTISECELVTSNPAGVSLNGPTGVVVVVLTNNLNRHAAPAPHEDATVDVRVDRSALRAVGGGRSLFAANFAARGRIGVELTENVLQGTLEALGGLSRPDEVTRARITIRSRDNVYAASGPPAIGWMIMGGTTPPVALGTASTSSNGVFVDSKDDRIDGPVIGILAHAGRRLDMVSGPSSDNRVDLRLRSLEIRTAAVAGLEPSDLVLEAALAGGSFPTGDRNLLTVDMHKSSGSGPRDNSYAHTSSFGPPTPGIAGMENRLSFAGTLAAFQRTNDHLEPAPAAEFFDR